MISLVENNINIKELDSHFLLFVSIISMSNIKVMRERKYESNQM